jgi:CRISPR/Cas system-associated exonuclease Cas4 (RecB family)
LGKYDSIIDKMVFSYSNASTFETCNLAWKLTYIDKENRQENAFSGFGNLGHDILEKFFIGKIEIFEMLPYYVEHYNEYIKSAFPITFGKDLAPIYYQQGYNFFENFNFDKNKYDVIETETFTVAKINDINITTKPDMLLKEKESGKIILLDYKSANPYNANHKLIKSKIDGYKKQLNLYANILWSEREVKVDEEWLWFFRTGEIEKFPVNVMEASNDMAWFLDVIEKIKNEEKFIPNTNKENKWFCQNLCGVSENCFYRDIVE